MQGERVAEQAGDAERDVPGDHPGHEGAVAIVPRVVEAGRVGNEVFAAEDGAVERETGKFGRSPESMTATFMPWPSVPPACSAVRFIVALLMV